MKQQFLVKNVVPRAWPGSAVRTLLVRAVALFVLVLIPLARAEPDCGRNGNPGIIPPESNPLGKTYGEWAVAWWQWALGIPEAQNPVADTTGEFAGVGQSGPVWFLAGTFGFSAERTVTIPTDKPIFMPVHNWIFGAGVFDCEPTVPGVTCEVATLRENAAAIATAAEVLEFRIDGREVRHIRDYRATSPDAFSVTFPDGAVFGIPAGTHSPHITDGYWLMLEPLRQGAHTIELHVVNSAAGIDMNLVIHINAIKPARIVPPDERHRGRTYAEWSAKWLEWFMEFPVDDPERPHPAFDDPNFDVRDGQKGSVWFLTGIFGAPVERTITVPSGKALLVPVLNAEASSLEDPPFGGATYDERRDAAKWQMDHGVDPFFFLDGVPVPLDGHASSRRNSVSTRQRPGFLALRAARANLSGTAFTCSSSRCTKARTRFAGAARSTSMRANSAPTRSICRST